MTGRIQDVKIAIFGLGCVGVYTAEILARNGAGALELTDGSKVGLSKNGCYKTNGLPGTQVYRVDLEKQRMHKLYPNTVVQTNRIFFSLESVTRFDFQGYDYVVDVLDLPERKLALAACAAKYGLPLVSCMNTKNRSNPTQIKIASVDDVPGSLVPSWMKMLRGSGPKHWKLIYSEEEPGVSNQSTVEKGCLECACPPDTAFVCERRRIKSSACNIYVSAMAGMLAGEEILMYLTHREDGK